MKTSTPLDNFVSMLKANQCLKSARLEHAVRAAPRQWFVDRMHTRSKYLRFIDVNTSRPTRHQLERIYSDEALLSRRDPPSSTSQPSLVMNMLEALDICPGARVLEIGAGTGWNAALMAHLVESSGSVVSIDNQPDVAQSARRHIKRAGLKNVHIAVWAIFSGQGNIAMRRDLAFFAHLEGLRVESLGNQFVLSAPDTKGLCVLDNTHINVIDGTECYRLYEKIQDKWLHLGAPKRLQYRVEVWPLAVQKRQPRDGWLTRRAHCQLIFRLK